MVGTCKECRFWKPDDTPYGEYFFGDCVCGKFNTNGDAKHDGLWIHGEGYESIRTGQDFGCVHFKAKE